ncbi:MAG: transglycosylase domain-containing protein [Clostridia bacterium]
MKIVKRIAIVIILMVMSIGLYIIGSGHEMYQKALEEKSIVDRVYEIKTKENYTSLKEIPPIYLKAVISVEDHRFYDHNGIDMIAIGRAIFNDIKAMKLVEGGSTITQQLAKNMYFTQEKKFTRKVAEMFMAFEIEKQYEKEEILELYLNTSYYGDGYYTIKEASRGYFHKEPNQMTDAQCILLAGIPNAPSVYAPTKNPDLAKQRQEQVINKMIKYGYLTQQDKEAIMKEEIN